MTDLSNKSAESLTEWGTMEVGAVQYARSGGAAAEVAARVALQSGLVFAWTAAGPVVPEMTKGRRSALVVKRACDVAMALVGLLILLPLLAAVALAIRLTSEGPVLLRQQRTGFSGQSFAVLKFRSMYVDQGDHSGVQQTRRGDTRVTPVGRFLRKTSIDELPQLFNILAGDMSIVGPRPHVPAMLAAGVEYSELVPYYELRHAMRPGLTGWAQANGLRGPTDTALHARARVNHDIAYIQNFSLLLDLRIILMTLQREFIGGTGV